MATHEPERTRADALIEDYLDHVAARLLALPRARRVELLTELRQHLRALAAAHEDLGASPGEAAHAAVRKFGDPTRIGGDYLHTWRSAVERQSLFPKTAVRHALGWFGGAAVVFISLFTADVSGLGNGALLGISTTKLSLAAFWLMPLAAGWKTGDTAPARPGLGAFYAQAALTTLAVPLAAPIVFGEYSRTAECLALIPLLLSLWIPLGSLSAALSDAFTQWRPDRFRFAP